MKKTLAFCVLLGMMVLCILPAMATAALPAEIQEALGDTPIVSTAQWEEAGHDIWFVLTRSQEGVNTLHGFTGEGGGWVESFFTCEAVPQEENRLDIHISEGAWDFRDMQNDQGQYLEGPILLILQYGADDVSIDQLICFQRSAEDIWNLIALRNYPAGASVNVDENSLTYYKAVDKAQIITVGTVPCTFGRDLRSFRLSDVPLTYQQAQDIGE